MNFVVEIPALGTIQVTNTSIKLNYGKKRTFNKKDNPCTNRIDRCFVADCLADVRSYNFQERFNEKHEGEENPEKMVISLCELDSWTPCCVVIL